MYPAPVYLLQIKLYNNNAPNFDWKIKKSMNHCGTVTGVFDGTKTIDLVQNVQF